MKLRYRSVGEEGARPRQYVREPETGGQGPLPTEGSGGHANVMSARSRRTIMGATTVADAMTTPVLTLAAATPIDEAIRAMREAGVGSLLVIDSECSPEGIFSSTVTPLADRSSAAACMASVEEYMTTDVHTTHSDTSLEAVTEEMIEREIDHLPVIDQDGNVTGILTTTDLVDHLSIEGSEQAAQVG